MVKPDPKSKLGLAYELLGRMYGGSLLSDDSPRTPLLIMKMIDTEYPSVLQAYLKELEYEGKNIDPALLVSYKVSLSPSERSVEYCGKKFVVKTVELPTGVQFKGKPAIAYVGGEDSDGAFFWGRSAQEAMSLAQGTRFVEGRPAYYLEGNTLSVILPRGYGVFSSLLVTMVPEDPSATMTGACFDIFSGEYPMLGLLWTRVKDKILLGDAQIMNQGVQLRDTVNDGEAA